MKIDSLWLKMFGVMAVLNLVYWGLGVAIIDFNNAVSGSVAFSIYVAPVILPFAPWIEQYDSSVWLVPLVGAMCVVFLPLFWSLVLYGIIRAVRAIRNRMK